MRRFSSYGPVDPTEHFCVERRELVERCVEELIGNPNHGGHYFTLWAPRQTGKTWIMRRAAEEIRARYGDRFVVGVMTMQGTLGGEATERTFLDAVPDLFREAFSFEPRAPADWKEWMRLFARSGGAFDKPVILLIDEIDSLPPDVIDRLVGTFRKIYLTRDAYSLHAVALVGVRAVLGVESARGSPFNVQRSLPIPNLTSAEVTDLFAQYQAESGQVVEPRVVSAVFEMTRGQPGLVSWFGELLTERYNPGSKEVISIGVFEDVLSAALTTEWNNTILNLVAKARGPHLREVISLFTDPNVPFSLDNDACAYLYMNGIIDKATEADDLDTKRPVCRFSSPFVQRRLYNALTGDMFGEKGPILALSPGDTLSDVFLPDGLRAHPLIDRYRGYLRRLKARGIDPWQGQPRRADLRLTEAVGHFHLYAWLLNALGRRASVSPEFPTGNGKVDLVVRSRHGMGVIEVKSFVDMYELGRGYAQTAGYAKKLGLSEATMVVFVPVPEAEIPKEVGGEVLIEGVTVHVSAIGWI